MANVSHLNVQLDLTMEEAFPKSDPGMVPYGSRVLVQIRTSKNKTKGGIILTDDVKDTEQWNQQVGKVIAVGPLAFKNRQTQEPWPEGVWASPGDFVRFPKYGGDKFQVEVSKDVVALFVVLNDTDLIGKVTGDPLKMRAFV